MSSRELMPIEKRTRYRMLNAPQQRRQKKSKDLNNRHDCFTKPSIYHAVVVIFLEFFAWGLLTNLNIQVIAETFPRHTFLMNGLIQGVKGILAFLAAPLLGALSDVWGRKLFLLVSVAFTCMPIPLLRISPWWYFTAISLSGIFSITYSIVFAYVADITDKAERHTAYGMVSATFAASIVTSPAIGVLLEQLFGASAVVLLATAVASLDLLFIIVCVPESLAEELRPATWGTTISWDKADPFGSLRRVGRDPVILLLSLTVFFSYIPESGQYSCFFVYLSKELNFKEYEIAAFIATIGLLSVFAQTALLTLLINNLGNQKTLIIGLVFEFIQMAWYAVATSPWMIWVAGVMAAVSTICYPAISSYASSAASADQQGVSQGVVTGVRGLCYGLGPALFGLIFFLFDVDLESPTTIPPPITAPGAFVPGFNASTTSSSTTTAALFVAPQVQTGIQRFIPGPPFAFGAIFVMFAIIIAFFMPRSANMLPLNNSSASSNGSQGGLLRQQKQLTIHLGELDNDDDKQQEQIEPLLDVGSAQE